MALRRGQRQRARQPHRHHFRRTAVVAAGVALAIGGTAVRSAPARAQDPAGPAAPEGFNKGTGSATAESIRLDPVAGGLSFGIGIGESLAAHRNVAATAESRSMNLGVIGTSLAAEPCDGGEPTLADDRQPQPLRVESTEEGAEHGKTGQDPRVPGVDRAVRATRAPFAEAATSTGNLDVPSLVSVQGVRATASSGVHGDVREAIARTEIGRIVVADVELRGLVWEAVHRTGSTDEQTATFTIDAMTVAGSTVPVDDPLEALAEANEALRPLGLELRPPRARFDDTARGRLASVDPLGVRLVPSPLRDAVLNPILSALQPARDELFNAIIEADCSNASYITVVDVVLNAFGAGGHFAVELGGVQATTAELRLYEGLGVGGTRPAAPAAALPASGSTGGPAVPAADSSRSAASPPAAAPMPPAAAPPSALDAADAAAGTRGGALAAVAAVGLALLAVTAEGDRRAMRRALREIPMEA